MTLSERGLGLLTKFEGYRAEAYLDSAGVPTIGYGHTKNVKLGDTVTQEQALELLKEDVEDAENAVNQLVEVPLEQHQFDALVSLVYNIGPNAFAMSTLLNRLNQADYDGAAAQFLLWCNSGGKLLAGLVTRRRKEKALFEVGDLLVV